MNLFSLIIHRSWEKQSLIFEDFLKKKKIAIKKTKNKKMKLYHLILLDIDVF